MLLKKSCLSQFMENHSEFTEPNHKALEQNSNIYDDVFLNHSFLVEFCSTQTRILKTQNFEVLYILCFLFLKRPPAFGFQTFVFWDVWVGCPRNLYSKRFGINELYHLHCKHGKKIGLISPHWILTNLRSITNFRSNGTGTPSNPIGFVFVAGMKVCQHGEDHQGPSQGCESFG